MRQGVGPGGGERTAVGSAGTESRSPGRGCVGGGVLDGPRWEGYAAPLCCAGPRSTPAASLWPFKARPLSRHPAPWPGEGVRGNLGGDWRSARPLPGPRAVGTGSPV